MTLYYSGPPLMWPSLSFDESGCMRSVASLEEDTLKQTPTERFMTLMKTYLHEQK